MNEYGKEENELMGSACRFKDIKLIVTFKISLLCITSRMTRNIRDDLPSMPNFW